MNIEFTGKHAENENDGINFQVMVNQESFICTVSREALQDIDPINRTDSSIEQYKNNQISFENIARKKILNSEISNKEINILSADVTK